MTLPMPEDLSRLVRVDLGFSPGHIVVIVLEDEADRCDDENCTLEHRIVTHSVSRTVDASPENFRALAEHFASLGGPNV